MQVIDEILCFLESGHWYSLQDVNDRCSLPQRKSGLVLSFLDQYGFIEVDEKEQKVRLHSRMMTFINGLHEK